MSRDIQFRAWWFDAKLMTKSFSLGSAEADCGYGYSDFDNSEVCHLMQFTGLKDKNGKEIYEGDIVEKKLVKNYRVFTIGSFNPFVVEWNTCGFNLSFMNKHTCEVLGNIYENPEMIK